jgi:hypothetical protein
MKLEPLGVERFVRLLSLFGLKRNDKYEEASEVAVEELVAFLSHFSKWNLNTCDGFDEFVKENKLDVTEVFGGKETCLDVAEARRLLSIWIISQSSVALSLWEGNHRGYPLKNLSEGFYKLSNKIPLKLETDLAERTKFDEMLNSIANPIHRKTFVTVGVCRESTVQTTFRRFQSEGQLIQKSTSNTVKGGWPEIMKQMCLEIGSDAVFEEVKYENFFKYEPRPTSGTASAADKVMKNNAEIFLRKAISAMNNNWPTVTTIFNRNRNTFNAEILAQIMTEGFKANGWFADIVTAKHDNIEPKGNMPWTLPGPMQLVRWSSYTHRGLDALRTLVSKTRPDRKQRLPHSTYNGPTIDRLIPPWLQEFLIKPIYHASIVMKNSLVETINKAMSDQPTWTFNKNMKKKLDVYLKHMITVDIISTLNIFGMDPELSENSNEQLKDYLE